MTIIDSDTFKFEVTGNNWTSKNTANGTRKGTAKTSAIKSGELRRVSSATGEQMAVIEIKRGAHVLTPR